MSGQQPEFDYGTFRSRYIAYEPDGTELDSTELLDDVEGQAWGYSMSMDHPRTLFVVAHRKTAATNDVLGRWENSERYDVPEEEQGPLLKRFGSHS